MSSHSSDHSQSRQENAIEATRFFGDVDLTSSSTYSRYHIYDFEE